MNFDLLSRITSNPRQCGGRPCIRGMRIRVKDILDMLTGGATEAEILADYLYLEPDDIRACLEYASQSLRGFPTSNGRAAFTSADVTRIDARADAC